MQKRGGRIPTQAKCVSCHRSGRTHAVALPSDVAGRFGSWVICGAQTT